MCDPRDGSPPGSPIPGILQARVLEWGAIVFSECNHKGPYKSEAGDQRSRGEVSMESRGWGDTKKELGSKECRQPLEAENSNEIDLPLKLLE